jgi:hypothetical protein
MKMRSINRERLVEINGALKNGIEEYILLSSVGNSYFHSKQKFKSQRNYSDGGTKSKD